MNFDLRDSVEDDSQRMLNALEPGTVLPIHRHRTTSETVVILRGRAVYKLISLKHYDVDCRLNVPTLSCGGMYSYIQPDVDFSQSGYCSELISVMQ